MRAEIVTLFPFIESKKINQSLHIALDNLFRSPRKDAGSNSRHTVIVTKEEERQLWETNVMNVSLASCVLL